MSLMNKGLLPKLSDFSENAAKRAALSDIVQHPFTLYTTAAGFLGSLTFLLFEPTIFATVSAVGGLTLGMGSLAVNYLFRRESFANRHIQKLHKRMLAHKQQILSDLQRDLSDLCKVSGFHNYAKQGSVQLKKNEEKFNTLESILVERLDRNELTFGRYLGTARQVYLSILDNLVNVVSTLKSAAAIDVNYINERLKTLNSLEEPVEADLEEISTLEQRRKLLDAQVHSVNVLLTRNEEAMTEMDNTTAAIAQMKTVRGQASVDLDTAMQDLEELAGRAQEYSLSSQDDTELRQR